MLNFETYSFYYMLPGIGTKWGNLIKYKQKFFNAIQKKKKEKKRVKNEKKKKKSCLMKAANLNSHYSNTEYC